MDALVTEWIGMMLRWLHVIAGIAWIGSSFYFVHLDLSLATLGKSMAAVFTICRNIWWRRRRCPRI
jgi:uncharacterized membrane protein